MPGKTNVGGLSDADLEALLGEGTYDADTDDAGDSTEGAPGAAEGDDTGSGDAGAGASDDSDDEFPDREAFLASLSPAQRKHYDAALDKANGNARRNRTKLQELKKAAPSPADMPAKAAAAGDAKTDAPVDVEAVKAQLRAELEAEFNSKREADKAAVEATRQLVTAGLQLPEDPKRRREALTKAVGLLDLDSADPDDVELAVSELQDTMPSLFGAKPQSRRTGKVGGPTSTQATKPKNPIEALFD